MPDEEYPRVWQSGYSASPEASCLADTLRIWSVPLAIPFCTVLLGQLPDPAPFADQVILTAKKILDQSAVQDDQTMKLRDGGEGPSIAVVSWDQSGQSVLERKTAASNTRQAKQTGAQQSDGTGLRRDAGGGLRDEVPLER